MVLNPAWRRTPSSLQRLSEVHWRKVWSTNPLERLHREIKRRTDVVGVFPTTRPSSAWWPLSSSETHDEWQVADRRYLSETSMVLLRRHDALARAPRKVHDAALSPAEALASALWRRSCQSSMSRRSGASAARRCPRRFPTRCVSRSRREGNNVSIDECRPVWRGAPGEWTTMPVAQLRYDGDGAWTLYFGDRNGKWTLSFDLEPEAADGRDHR